MDFPEVSEDERPVKLEAPAEPDDSDAGLDDTALFQYHRRSRGPSTQDYSIVYAAGPTKQARTQHVDNLMAVLEEGLLQGRYERVAEAASILVPLTEAAGKSKGGTLHIQQQSARQLRAVHGALECVQQGDRGRGPAQLLRLLPKLQALQTRPGEVQMEQARSILLSGDLQHACDTAAEVLGIKASREVHFAAHALCGLLSHTLWAASLQSGATGKGAAASRKRKAVDWFAPAAGLQAAAGRAAAEYQRDAEKHMQEALLLQPGAVEIAFALTQIHFATGRPEQVLSAAQSMAESNPEDVNAHALHLLCMEALGTIDDSPAEALAACTKMLQCDGSSHSAAAVAQRLSFSHSLPAPDVAEALVLHVEACMPAVSQRAATSKGVSGQEQHVTGAASNNSQGAAREAEEGMYPLPVMQALGQSWQALADVICQAGLEAIKAGIPGASLDAEPQNQLALVDPSNMSAVERWNKDIPPEENCEPLTTQQGHRYCCRE
ncbi:g3810 [Coccomyxa viridis]|uniref:G3810 protein n=1 Tax=Coccomyxa viridis TaxID=1274662 RepID=A0ABP1FQA2_9CHLO